MKKNILGLLMVGQFGMTLADEAAEYSAKRQEAKKIIKCCSLFTIEAGLNSIDMTTLSSDDKTKIFQARANCKKLLNDSDNCLSKEFAELRELFNAVSSARTESEEDLAVARINVLMEKKIEALGFSVLEMEALADEASQEISQEMPK